MTIDSVRHRGQQTQVRILERAVQIASVKGLEAMSLATLADAAQMSKSGLFAHFRSKEALQLAIIDEADRMFRAAVIEPTRGLQGLARLQRLTSLWLEHLTGTTFDGGSFFAGALHEFDARPGPIRDRLRAFLDAWESELKEALLVARKTQASGAHVDVDRFIFVVGGIGMSANLHVQMGGERSKTLAMARAAMDEQLASLTKA
jgi:AcrR family transcriptional regulator